MKPREIGKKNGIVERIFNFDEPVINPKKAHKHQAMREQGITGKQFRRLEKKQRALLKAEGK
jgi:hypothetical protein